MKNFWLKLTKVDFRDFDHFQTFPASAEDYKNN